MIKDHTPECPILRGSRNIGPVDHPNNRWWTMCGLRSLLDRSHSLLLVQYAMEIIAQVQH